MEKAERAQMQLKVAEQLNKSPANSKSQVK